MLNKIVYFTIFLGVLLSVNPFITFAQPISDNYYHHINNNGVNNYNPKRADTYVYQHRHALQMGYSMVRQPVEQEIPYEEFAVMKGHGAAVSFMILRFHGDVKEYKYSRIYHAEYDPIEGKYRSAFDPEKHVETWYQIDPDDPNLTIIDDMKGYVCARSDPSVLTAENITAQKVKDIFKTAWLTERDGVTVMHLRSNWQSKTVVSEMAQKLIDTINHVPVDGIFFDQFGGGSTCINADYFGENDTYNSSPVSKCLE